MKQDRTDAETYSHWRITILSWLAAIVTPISFQRSGGTLVVVACGLLIAYGVYEGISAKLKGDGSTFTTRVIIPVVIAAFASVWAYRDRLFT